MNNPEIVNLYNMPKFIKDVSNCSGSVLKGETLTFTIEEAQALCKRNNLELLGAQWYDEELEAYTHFIAIDKDKSIFLICIAHHQINKENEEYSSQPFFRAECDNDGAPSCYSGDLETEFNNKIGQFIKWY